MAELRGLSSAALSLVGDM